MRIKKTVLGVAVLGALLLGTTAAFGAAPHATPAGGAIKVFVTPGNGNVSKIVITGAIGDFGTTVNVTKSGKPSSNGNYVKVKLHKGGFLVNAVALNKKINSATPNINNATCSFSVSASGPVTLSQGTGLYAGISGKLKIKVAFASLAPRTASGKCNLSNKARPIAGYQSIQGGGNVTFS
jgi:hypothetical protein